MSGRAEEGVMTGLEFTQDPDVLQPAGSGSNAAQARVQAERSRFLDVQLR